MGRPTTRARRWATPSIPRARPDPTVYVEKVSRVLAESSEPLCISEIKRIIGGKSEWVGVAVERLLEEGHATEQPGPRKARMITQVKPFRGDPQSEAQADPAEST